MSLNFLKKAFGKKTYIKKLKIYHKRLEKFIKETYSLDIIYLENIAWGYNTTAFYLKTNQGDFVARLVNYSKKKEESIQKDIYVTTLLADIITTPQYIKTNDGRPLVTFDENKLLRITEYVQGVPPFDMTLNILKEAIKQLKSIHQYPIKGVDLMRRECKNPKLLHGDLTPSNILVSFDKIVAVVDFEMSFIGPAEWDIARCAVFCWYRMKEPSFEEILHGAAKTYGDATIDTDLLIKFSIENAESHLENIISHEALYEDKKLWKKDLKIAENKLREIMQAFRN